MASALQNPVEATIGAAVGGATGTLSGATFLASEFAKVGKSLAGLPGEVSAAALGGGTGALVGFAVGSALGALAGSLMVDYVFGPRAAAATNLISGSAFLNKLPELR